MQCIINSFVAWMHDTKFILNTHFSIRIPYALIFIKWDRELFILMQENNAATQNHLYLDFLRLMVSSLYSMHSLKEAHASSFRILLLFSFDGWLVLGYFLSKWVDEFYSLVSLGSKLLEYVSEDDPKNHIKWEATTSNQNS